ncbi:hypothetical protein OC844_007984, partial [Tilletia horrida]
LEARRIQKRHYDGSRAPLPELSVGDLVFVRLPDRPIPGTRADKLAAVKDGPYQIVEVLSPHRVRLLLPDALGIGDGFDVSQLDVMPRGPDPFEPYRAAPPRSESGAPSPPASPEDPAPLAPRRRRPPVALRDYRADAEVFGLSSATYEALRGPYHRPRRMELDGRRVVLTEKPVAFLSRLTTPAERTGGDQNEEQDPEDGFKNLIDFATPSSLLKGPGPIALTTTRFSTHQDLRRAAALLSGFYRSQVIEVNEFLHTGITDTGITAALQPDTSGHAEEAGEALALVLRHTWTLWRLNRLRKELPVLLHPPALPPAHIGFAPAIHSSAEDAMTGLDASLAEELDSLDADLLAKVPGALVRCPDFSEILLRLIKHDTTTDDSYLRRLALVDWALQAALLASLRRQTRDQQQLEALFC